MSIAGKGRVFRTYKQKIEVSKLICDEYKKGLSTIQNICEVHGIPYRTFHEWSRDWSEASGTKRPKGWVAEIASMFRECGELREVNYRGLIKSKALESLMKRVEGYEYEEITMIGKEVKKGDKTEIVPSQIKKVRKHVPASDTAITFALKNLDPTHFSDTIINKHEGDMDIRVKKMKELTDEELDAKIAEYEKALGKNKK